ncbi:hypothetical protein BJX65DRAFT_271192 [Aspergillus insuetus]
MLRAQLSVISRISVPMSSVRNTWRTHSLASSSTSGIDDPFGATLFSAITVKFTALPPGKVTHGIPSSTASVRSSTSSPVLTTSRGFPAPAREAHIAPWNKQFPKIGRETRIKANVLARVQVSGAVLGCRRWECWLRLGSGSRVWARDSIFGGRRGGVVKYRSSKTVGFRNQL